MCRQCVALQFDLQQTDRFFDNTAFSTARTRILSKYRKNAVDEIYLLLEFQMSTVRASIDMNFYIFFVREPYLWASFKWHKKTFSVKFVRVVEV